MDSFKQFVVCLSLVLALCGVARPAEIFVDQDNPKADDKNAGTEAAPFKTIQPAVNLAKAGDRIWVKAGFYEGLTKIDSQGRRSSPITLAAWKNDHVVIGSHPKPAPGKDAWKPIPGTKSWQTTLAEDAPKDLIVLFNGKPQPCEQKDTPPKDDQILWSTYRAKDRTLMVNAGGMNPAEKYELVLSVQREGYFYLTLDSANWIIRGFEFGHADCFICNFGYNIVIEDCYFHHAYFRAIFGTGYLSTVRRCTFNDSAFVGGPGAGTVFEDNIFYRGSRTWEETPRCRVTDYHEGAGGVMFKGCPFHTFRHNFFDEEGLSMDANGISMRIYGNAFHDSTGYAIYNEYAIDDSLILGNYMGNCQAGVVSSWSSRMSVLDNFIVGPGSGVILYNRDKFPLRSSFMTIRGNAIVGSPLPLSGYSGGYDSFPEGWSNCLVDFNRYRIKSENSIMLDLNGKKRYKTFEDMQKATGWDMHGQAKPYDPKNNDLTPESLGGGTVTVRVPIGENGWKSREMPADPGVEGKFPACVRMVHAAVPTFFWRVADGNYDYMPVHRGGTEYMWEDLWFADASAGYGEGEWVGCAWYVGADPLPKSDLTWTGLLDNSAGNKFLVVHGKTPEKMLPQGTGFWTPVLPTASGAVIDVSLKVRGYDLQPSGENGGAAVFARFTSLTGQNVTRQFVLGADDQHQPHNAKLLKGSYEWTEVKETVTAPKDAAHVALFVGMRPGKGKVNYDDINLKTRPGDMPASAKGSVCPLPRLPLQRFRDTFFVDIKPFANRAFADDEANNGIGGWSDQGPNCDMREFKTGQRKFGGVPFDILPAPKSLVVLKSSRREAGKLPDKVVIPVGKPADTLFFLHAEAWGGEELDWQYIIHYADGKDVTLNVGRKNGPGWAGRPKTEFPEEQTTITVPAETVPTPQFGQGTMFRMEWNSPADRRGIKIISIEFVHSTSSDSVPILGGITGVVEW